MRPVLFRWRDRVIWSYPAMLYIGLVAGVAAGNLAAHASGIDPFRVYVATLLLLVPALVGARLQFVLSHWSFYRQNPHLVWDRGDGGGSMYGGLPLAILFSFPLIHALRLDLGAFWDVAVFTILVGMIFTRVGCLLNGCCAGRPCEKWLSAYLPNHRGIWQNRVPTQVLEAFWALVLLLLAVQLRQVVPFPGALFLVVAAGYACGRFLLEFTREREPGAAGVTWDHGISIVTLLASVTLFIFFWRK
jgi:phosphatidylglycerol---prolipoprotein diacylglyceryl transferase